MLPIHIENLCRLSRGFYIYISSSWHHIFHIFAIPPVFSCSVFIEIYPVGDNRRPVNSPTSLHISDQLGTENVWETLLCWLIVVLWVRKNMYRRERHFGSFHRYSSLLMSGAHVSDCAIELTEAGSRSGTKTSSGGGWSYIFRTLNSIPFFPDKSRYHRIFTLSGLFRTCQAPDSAAEVDPIAHFGHFRSHLATCTW